MTPSPAPWCSLILSSNLQLSHCGHDCTSRGGGVGSPRAEYIRAFDEEAAKAEDSAALIAALKQRDPDLGDESSLELSATVATDEMERH